jgi:phosphoglycerol transferase MdoB-like AlkP superfamily enzyme
MRIVAVMDGMGDFGAIIVSRTLSLLGVPFGVLLAVVTFFAGVRHGRWLRWPTCSLGILSLAVNTGLILFFRTEEGTFELPVSGAAAVVTLFGILAAVSLREKAG